VVSKECRHREEVGRSDAAERRVEDAAGTSPEGSVRPEVGAGLNICSDAKKECFRTPGPGTSGGRIAGAGAAGVESLSSESPHAAPGRGAGVVR
jgi:hypothetical protein